MTPDSSPKQQQQPLARLQRLFFRERLVVLEIIAPGFDRFERFNSVSGWRIFLFFLKGFPQVSSVRAMTAGFGRSPALKRLAHFP